MNNITHSQPTRNLELTVCLPGLQCRDERSEKAVLTKMASAAYYTELCLLPQQHQLMINMLRSDTL